jgi:hypothetical protein
MDSMKAAQTLDVLADLIYIDASHEEEDVYNDVLAWYKKLKVGGIMCGDDYGGGGKQQSIKKGVDRAAAQLGVKVNIAGGWFWFFPPKK